MSDFIPFIDWLPNLTVKETLLVTERFRVERVERRLANGTLKQREIIRHPGSVVILPLIGDDKVCLIKNFRLSVNEWLIELPAGTLEDGEHPRDCAQRELTEETGFHAGGVEWLAEFLPAPGILDEKMHLYAATDLVEGSPAREAEEEIENMVVPWADALSLIKTGGIHDAKTMLGLLWYDGFRRP